MISLRYLIVWNSIIPRRRRDKNNISYIKKNISKFIQQQR